MGNRNNSRALGGWPALSWEGVHMAVAVAEEAVVVVEVEGLLAS